MPDHSRGAAARLLSAVGLALALVACSAPASGPTPSPEPPPTVEMPAPAAPVERPTPPPEPPVAAAPTSRPAATEPPATAATAVAESAPAPLAQGQPILTLAPGSGRGQVGIGEHPDDAGLLLGPSAFRIGADGSIRLLDPLNKRVLFYAPDGALTREASVADAQTPVDFIVNTAGEMFVFDAGVRPEPGAPQQSRQVLHYSPAGALTASYPVSSEISATGIMLTANQDLVLVWGSLGNNALATTILHSGLPLAAEHQPLTMRHGMPTPRSGVLFSTQAGSAGGLDLKIGPLTDDAGVILSGLALPATAQFLNVDRAMNLYIVDDRPGDREAAVWRVAPDGMVAGAASISYADCQGWDWRSIYADQAGALWSLCTTAQGSTVLRYDLSDPGGQPLPEAAAQPPEGVVWTPGRNLAA